MQYAPTRVRAKFGGFHIPAHEYTKNAPDFTLPNKDTPKTHPILYPNLWRGTFRGVCNTPLHGCTQKIVWFHISPPGYTKNPPDFRRKPSSQDISGCMQYAPTRVRAKPGGFHISPSEYAKNAPDFTLPNKDIPKSCPVLGANPCRRTFGGVCFCTPTRVRAKSNGFHISAPEYVKNPPDFTHPNRDTPKPHPVLGANSCRRTFRGVCFCALHGYMKNLAGFIFPHTT